MIHELKSYTTSEGVKVEVIHDERLRARSLHRCSDCAGDIEKGEQYRRVAMKVEGEYVVFKQHLRPCPLTGDSDPW